MTTRAILVLLAIAAAGSPAAHAHVTAQPPELPAGAFVKVTFRAPNEREVPTTRIAVRLPPELDSVRVQPVPGWDHEITRAKLPTPREVFGETVTDYVSTIEWTGGRIRPDEFQEFPVSMRLPEKGTFGRFVTFPATQTYRNGEVVRWIQTPETPTGDFDELDEPAPRVELVAEDAESASGAARLAATVTPAQLDAEVSGPRTLGLVGTVAGGVALLLAAGALMRRRR